MSENDLYIRFHINHDGESRPLKPFWSATGYANADFTVTPHFLRMYDYLSSFQGHLHYMRLHNILTLHGQGDRYLVEWDMPYGNREFAWDNRHNGDDQVVVRLENGQLQYNWKLVDQVYDVIIGHGMAPIVELVYLPSAIRKSEKEFFLPENYGVYGEVVKQFVSHCMERYGRDEVRGWYFEIWNEPDNEELWCKDPSSFLALYDYMEQAIHSVDSCLKTGGPATMQNPEGYEIFGRFLKHCAGEVNYCTGGYGTRLDFISVHCKGGHPTDFNPSIPVMFRSIEGYLDILKTYPQFQDTEFFNDESDIIWAGNKGVEDGSWFDFRNSHYAPGFVCKMVSLYCTKLLDQGVNLAIADSDNAHLQWEKSLFSGNRSQLTPLRSYPSKDMIKKPFFNAYVLLSRLGNQRLDVECHAAGNNEKFGLLATRNGRVGSYMVWNFEDGISDMYGRRSFELNIRDREALGTYYVAEYRIDQNHSNANSLWHEMGCPKEPSIEQIRKLRASDGLEPMGMPRAVNRDGKDFTLTLTLPQHGVSLLQIVPENMIPPEIIEHPKAEAEIGCCHNVQVFLRWKPSTEPDFFYYKIMRSVDRGEYEVLSDDIKLNTAIYVDMETEVGHSYSYIIMAVNYSGLCSGASETAVVKT